MDGVRLSARRRSAARVGSAARPVDGVAAGLLVLGAATWMGLARAAAETPAAPEAPTAVGAAPRLVVPPRWTAIPEAGRAAAALLRGADGAAAVWGDASHECFAVAVAARRPGAPLATVVSALRRELGVTETGSAGDAAAGSGAAPRRQELRLALPPPSAGAVQVKLSDDGTATQLRAALCSWGERFPRRCQRECEAVLASLEAP
jgi:hypothetical protein